MLRRSVRNRVSKKPPTLWKSQSTLTQLDFVDSPSSSSRLIADIASDEDDEDFSDPRPRKKQKRRTARGKKDPNQGTLTQNWRLVQFAKDSDDDDGDNDDILEVENRCDDGLQTKVVLGADTQHQRAILISAIDDEEDMESNHGQHRADSGYAVSPSCLAADRSDVSCMDRIAEPDASGNQPKTPRRQRMAEIPSSQTPSSIKLSMHRMGRRDSEQRSPLKERSTNMSPLKHCQSAVSHCGDDVDSGDLPLLNAEMNDERMNDETDSDAHWRNCIVITPGRDIKHTNPSLPRCTTIQDSEEEDQQLSPSGKAIRKFTRTATIQESEDGNDLDDPDAEVEYEHVDDDHDENDTFTYESMPFQNTFDPVAAALARDGARFGLTATQLLTQQQSSHHFGSNTVAMEDEADLVETHTVALHDIEEQDHEDDGDYEDDDLDKTVIPEPQIVISSQPDERRMGQRPPPNDDSIEKLIAEQIENDLAADVAAEPEFVASSQPEERIRIDDAEIYSFGKDIHSCHEGVTRAGGTESTSVTFQTPLVPDRLLTQQLHHPRPSQVSTFVPSQSSQPNATQAPPPSSPSQKQTKFSDTVSSSPFPLPPWSAEELAARMDMETQGSLGDFSLPRPPLWSSNTGSPL